MALARYRPGAVAHGFLRRGRATDSAWARVRSAYDLRTGRQIPIEDARALFDSDKRIRMAVDGDGDGYSLQGPDVSIVLHLNATPPEAIKEFSMGHFKHRRDFYGRSLGEAQHRVADFNTLDDLIAHARDDLGATHVVVSGPETRLYFPRGGQYPYEEARVWRKGGYWHAEGPSARRGVLELPEYAQPIGGRGGRRAAEAPRAGNPTTKPGKHGTLYLYQIEYRDESPGAPEFSTRLWAYNLEHAEDRFYEGPGAEGWRIVSVARVPESGGMHRATRHQPHEAPRVVNAAASLRVFVVENDDGVVLFVGSKVDAVRFYERHRSEGLAPPYLANPDYPPPRIGDGPSVAEAPRRPGAALVDDYIAVDRRGRTIAGPFKSYGPAKDAAGTAGVVQFVRPRARADEAPTRSAHHLPSTGPAKAGRRAVARTSRAAKGKRRARRSR